VVAQGCRPNGPVFDMRRPSATLFCILSAGQERNTAGELPAGNLSSRLTPLTGSSRHSLFFWAWVAAVQPCRPKATLQSPPAFLVRNLPGVRSPQNGAVGRGRVACGSASRCSFSSVMPPASRQELRPVCSPPGPHNESTRFASPGVLPAWSGPGALLASGWRRDALP